jgi:hypothetical protein
MVWVAFCKDCAEILGWGKIAVQVEDIAKDHILSGHHDVALGFWHKEGRWTIFIIHRELTFESLVTCPPQRDPARVLRFCWIEGGGHGQETV